MIIMETFFKVAWSLILNIYFDKNIDPIAALAKSIMYVY